MWSVPITTEVVSLISLHMVRCTGYNLHVSVTCSRLAVFSGYFIQHYVIKFVSDSWQVYGLSVIFGRLVLCQWLLAGRSFSQGNSIHYVIKLKLIVCNLWQAGGLSVTCIRWVVFSGYTLCDKVCQWLVAGRWLVSDLWQADDILLILQFPPLIKLTATI